MRAYSSLRQMQNLGICVDDYKTNEKTAFLLHGLTTNAGVKTVMYLPISLLKTAVKLWLPPGRTLVISAFQRLKKAQY